MKVFADFNLYGADIRVYYSESLKFSVVDTGFEYWGQKAPLAPGNPGDFLRIDEVGQQYYAVVDVNDISGLDARINTLASDTLASVSANSTDTAKSTYTMSAGIPVEWLRSGGSSMIKFDETSGNVGIGSNAPGAKLTVAGTLRFATGNHGNNKVLFSDANGNADWQDPLADGNPVKDNFLTGSTWDAGTRVLTLTRTGSLPDVTETLTHTHPWSEITGAPTIPNYTFSNGLTEATGAVKLGGTLTQNTLISDATNTYSHTVKIGTDPYSSINVEPFGMTLEVYDSTTPLTSTIELTTSLGLNIMSSMGATLTSAISMAGANWLANATSGSDYAQITSSHNTITTEIYNNGTLTSTYTELTATGLKIGKGSNGQTIVPGAGNWTLTLPTSGGTNNYVLKTNGSGTTSWGQVAYSELTGTPTIPDNYVSNVSLVGNLLTFTGVGSGFNSTVDLSAYASGGETLAQTLALGNTSGNYKVLLNKDYGLAITSGASQSYLMYAPAGSLYFFSDTNNGGQNMEIGMTGANQASYNVKIVSNGSSVIVNDTGSRVKINSSGTLGISANPGGAGFATISTNLITATTRDFLLPDWSGTISTIDRIGGQPVASNVTSPTVAENGYVIQWDNSLGQYKLVAGGGGSDGNDYVNSASFNTTDGVLTLTRTDTGTVTVDLDGRYLQSETPQNLFETIQSVADSGFTWGTSDVVADSATDTLKLVAGSGIAIDTDAAGDAIRIRTTGSGGITNAYTSITDGTTTATATGSDTIKFRSSDSSITVVAANNDATHGDNINLTINSVAWGVVTSTPTTIAGYGISDAYTQTQLQTSGQASVHWGNLTNVPTYDNYGGWTISVGADNESITSGATLNVASNGSAAVSYNPTTNTLTISATDTNTNDYVDSVTFSTATGVLTVGRTGALGDLTADLDDRWSLIGHTHASTDITDWSEAVDDRVATLLTQGSNVTLTYDDVANTLTIAATNTTYTASNGLALSSTDVQLGGTLTKNTVVNGGFQMYWGSDTRLTNFRVYTTNDVYLNTDGGLTINMDDVTGQIEVSGGTGNVYVSGNIVDISGTDTRIPYGAGTAVGKVLQTTNINGQITGTPYAFPTATGTDGQILKLSSGNLVWATDESGGGGGTFVSLTDTPSSYTGAGLQFVRVNTGATALEFIDATTLFASTSHSHAFADITSKPTTISGYGITDALIFKTISKAADSGFTWGSSDIVAASSTDTVKFVPGTGIGIDTDATGKAVRVSLTATIPSALNDLSDVTITSPSTGQVLTYNGTGWANANAALPSATVPTESGYSGTTMTLTAGESISTGDLVAINVSGQAIKASAGAATKTGPAIGYATSSVTASQSLVVVTDGFIYKASHGLTVSSVVYVGTTAGASVHTAPSGSGDLVQVVGIVVSANAILVRATLNVIELT